MIRYSTPGRRSFASTTAGRVEYTAKDNAYSYVEAGQSVSGAIKGFAVDLCGLQKKFCPGIYPVVLRSLESADHILQPLFIFKQYPI